MTLSREKTYKTILTLIFTKHALSAEAGPSKRRRIVGMALRAVAAAALVLVVSVVEFFSGLLS